MDRLLITNCEAHSSLVGQFTILTRSHFIQSRPPLTKLSMLNIKSTDCETHSVPVGQYDHFKTLLTHMRPDALVTLERVSLTRVALAIHYDFCGHFILFTRFEDMEG